MSMTSIEMDQLDQVAAAALDGYLVRKDLVRRYSRQYPVPTYVVEFLLGRYCASTDPEEIEEGLDDAHDKLVNCGEDQGQPGIPCSLDEGGAAHAEPWPSGSNIHRN